MRDRSLEIDARLACVTPSRLISWRPGCVFILAPRAGVALDAVAKRVRTSFALQIR